MPRDRSSAHSSDSEDSAPEVLTLSSTKKASQTRSEAVRAFETAQKAKRKRENRERDAALKEAKQAREEQRTAEEEKSSKRRKVKSKRDVKGKSKESELGAGMTSAEERMERAMQEAAEEDGGSDTDSVGEEDAEEWHGFDSASDTGGDMEESSAGASAKHLPDHLFAAAAAAAATKSNNATSLSNQISPKPRKKRKTSKAKELIVGSRTIRALPSAHPDSLTASLTLPPARINKFLKRTLLLKQSDPGLTIDSGQPGVKKAKVNSKGWVRRPVNLGVMRSMAGPAMRFVRGT